MLINAAYQMPDVPPSFAAIYAVLSKSYHTFLFSIFIQVLVQQIVDVFLNMAGMSGQLLASNLTSVWQSITFWLARLYPTWPRATAQNRTQPHTNSRRCINTGMQMTEWTRHGIRSSSTQPCAFVLKFVECFLGPQHLSPHNSQLHWQWDLPLDTPCTFPYAIKIFEIKYMLFICGRMKAI